MNRNAFYVFVSGVVIDFIIEFEILMIRSAERDCCSTRENANRAMPVNISAENKPIRTNGERADRCVQCFVHRKGTAVRLIG